MCCFGGVFEIFDYPMSVAIRSIKNMCIVHHMKMHSMVPSAVIGKGLIHQIATVTSVLVQLVLQISII